MLSANTITDPAPLKPKPFLLLGCGLFVLKFVIDRTIASIVFGRTWSIYNYLLPVGALSNRSGPDSNVFGLTMIGIAIPFVITGIILTSRRLRDADLSQSLLLLFFIPVVNLIFFAALGLMKSPPDESDIPMAAITPEQSPIAMDYERMRLGLVGNVVPEAAHISMLTSAAIVAPLGPVMAAIGVFALQNYGWGLFVGMPFLAGMLSVVIHGWNRPRSLGSCVMTSTLAVTFGIVAIFLFAIEGAVCLIFLLPMAIPIGILGGMAGYAIQSARWPRQSAGNLLILIVVLPVIMGAERVTRDAPTLFCVRSAVDVNAAPEDVWKNVVSFAEIPPPKEFLFSTGVAYPQRARIEGAGVGAVRYCEFSTGAFVEPIEVWDEPHLLKFSVTKNPPPMREWSFFRIHPPHLENFLMSHGGQFKLIPLPGNRTRLEGTTWYEHRMWPEAYWSIWTDWVIHQIHGRVLEHVKRLSESRDVSVPSPGNPREG